MNQNSKGKTARRPRADSVRNRQRLVAAAKTVFATKGASTSLDQVAREAGVGIGTLYRHFPTRDELIRAVYEQETDTLMAAAVTLRQTQDPLEALHAWLLQFVDFLEAKRGMMDVLSTLIGGPEALYSGTSDRLADAIGALMANAVKAGEIESGIEPLDLLRAIGGVANLTPGDNWRRSAAQMIDVMLKGMRTTQ